MLIINKDSLDCHLVAPHCRPLYPTSGQDCRPQGRDGHRPDPRPPRLQERQPRVRHRPAQTEFVIKNFVNDF